MNNASHRYLLDTNVFIQAYQKYYAFDLAPPFWAGLARCARYGYVRSVDRVLDEINRKDDPLAEWANTEFRTWFKNTNQSDVASSYAQLIEWSRTKDYIRSAIRDFAEFTNADAWVVAYAHANGFVVVTEEKINREIRRRIPIPNVCQDFDVKCVNTFDMMRQINIHFR